MSASIRLAAKYSKPKPAEEVQLPHGAGSGDLSDRRRVELRIHLAVLHRIEDVAAGTSKLQALDSPQECYGE
jgi:hypothetical protein